MARLSRMIGQRHWAAFGERQQEEEHWLVGGRYEVSSSIVLRSRPDTVSSDVGQLFVKDTVLLLALREAPAQNSPAEISPATEAGGGEGLLAYLANTRRAEWICGWGLIEDPRLQTKALLRRRLRGSWQIGGRYTVLGDPVLREGIELESDKLADIKAREEVLVLDLALVLRSGEPRLRAYIRSDAGDLGWLTIELSGGGPLLEPLNLYSAEAVSGRGLFDGMWSRSKLPRGRIMASGDEEVWVVGGLYRTLVKAPLSEGCEFDSRHVCIVRKGSLVFVKAIQHMPRPQGGLLVRLEVVVESHEGERAGGGGSEHQPTGWLTPLTPSGEPIVDIRDQLEYDKVLNGDANHAVTGATDTVGPPTASANVTDVEGGGCSLDGAEGHLGGAARNASVEGDEAEEQPSRRSSNATLVQPYSVDIDRSMADTLGLDVLFEKGETLIIDAILEGPFRLWNAQHPKEQVCIGDRIVDVNGRSGDASILVEELSKRQVLRITLHHPMRPWTNDVALAEDSQQDVPFPEPENCGHDHESEGVQLVPPELGMKHQDDRSWCGSSSGVSDPPPLVLGMEDMEDARGVRSPSEPLLWLPPVEAPTATFGFSDDDGEGTRPLAASTPTLSSRTSSRHSIPRHAAELASGELQTLPPAGARDFANSSRGSRNHTTGHAEKDRTTAFANCVARPYVLSSMDDHVSETRLFGDAAVEAEGVNAVCPCQNERGYFLGCGGTSKTSWRPPVPIPESFTWLAPSARLVSRDQEAQ
eukprot:TRINITY_DN68640_c0_g1_i1.p1 TRINITY_DN68640_c0_g1~~TRINITY_DN68640_c0_g1_i1.p1  ORF type:complete len:756 (+),score=114.98 TRINITY_DN68640_c0_g1_i1:139-2406(+)